MYIVFMTLIGVAAWMSTDVIWFIPIMFVLSLIPANLIIFAVIAGATLLISGCTTYSGDVININISTPVGSMPITIRDPNNPYRR